MKFSNITSIISIASVLLFFIIMYAFPGSPAWLVFLVGVLAIAVARLIFNSKEGDDK